MVQLRLDLGCCARGHGPCHPLDIAYCARRETRQAASLRKIGRPSRKKQRACEQLSFACPPRPDLTLILPLFFFSGAWIQEQRSVVSDLAEVKRLVDGVGERIE